MKPLRFLIPALFYLTGCMRPEAVQPVAETCAPDPLINQAHPKAFRLQQLMDAYTAEGVPGVSMAIYTPSGGYWAGASGYAHLEGQTPLRPCHLLYGQSVAKTYMATAIMQLMETKQLEPDAPMTRYLPDNRSVPVTDADKITVRMLLNHTSGIHDYAEDPAYVAFLLQNPMQKLSPDELLKYVAGKPLEFTPGSQHRYSNTNYLLLALIADALTGDHTQFIQKSILTPLNLGQTIYHDSENPQNRTDIVNSYFDRFGNGRLENVSDWQRTNVGNMIGDDGIIASPLDYVRFLKGLFSGQLVTNNSLKLMTTWVNNRDDKPTYGLGLYRMEVDGKVAYGHGGAGIGAGCALYFFPETGLYVFIGTNVGTITDGPVVRRVAELRDKLLSELL